jgi:HK97 family phage major capsid protein
MFGGNTEWTTGQGGFITPANHGPATDEIVINQGQFITTVSISKRELNYAPENLEALIRERINRAAARTIDAVIINGDAETGATGNVNLVDAAPTT